jgi:alpha-beta hydrolase superfamily lysophospholipase
MIAPSDPLSRATDRPPPAGRWRRALAGAALVGMVAAAAAGCAALDEQQRRWIFQPSDRAWSGGLAAAQGMTDVWIEFDEGRPEDARSMLARQTPPAHDRGRSGADGASAADRTPAYAAHVAADAEPAGLAAPALPMPGTVQLHALWLPQADPAAPVLLYLHGARWDVRGSAHRMRRLHDMGFAVLGVDYRGFGQSTAALPSEASAVEDALAAWHWMAAQWPQRQRFVFGHSLGGAVAVQLAARLGAAQAGTAATPAQSLAGLIVEGSFTSIADVYRTLKWGWLPLQPLITQRFDAGEQMAGVKAPVLVVHGSEDRLISPALGRALFDRAPGPKRFVLVRGGSHHNANAVGQAEVRAAMAELFGLGAAVRQ